MVWSQRIVLLRRISVFALFCLAVLPGASSGQDSWKTQIARGQLREAAETLETEAARSPDRAGELFRAAGWMRERLGELGQALLDYRAMMAAAPVSFDLGRHMAHLSLLIDQDRQLVGLPLASELQLDTLFPGWTGRQQVREKAASGDPSGSLAIPGGVPLLARILGIDEGSLKGPEALERVFSLILKSASDAQDDSQNPARRDVLSCLRHYADLNQYLQKQHLLPPDSGPVPARRVDFPLLGERAVVERTRKLLSFFGIDYQLKRPGGGGPVVTLRLREGQTHVERQLLLRIMGNTIMDRNLRSIHLILGGGSLPLLLDPGTWERILLVKAGSRPLFYHMVENTNAMRLYLALSRCSAAARELLVRSVPGRKLLEVAGVLENFGSALDVRDQHLNLPGLPESWERFVGAPGSNPGRFVPALVGKDAGRGLVLYSSLSSAPEPVSDYFGSSPDRLIQLYQRTPRGDVRASSHRLIPAPQDLGRLLRLMSADEHGLSLVLSPRLAGSLFQEMPDRKTEADPGPIRLDRKELELLFDMAGAPHSTAAVSQLDLLEFLRYVQQTRPDMLTGENISAMMKSPEQIPVFMDLVWDINPDPKLVPKYLDFCRSVAAAGQTGWNVNRTRSSQSLFFLITALCREGALTRKEANELLADSLAALSTHDEAIYAQCLADFLVTRLLPRIGKPGDEEIILHALAGQAPVRTFAFEGSQVQLDLSAYRFQRMKGTIRQQHYAPLPLLLEIYGILKAMPSGAQTEQDPLAASLAEKLSRLEPAPLPPASSKFMRESVARAEIDKLMTKAGPPGRTAAEIAAQLHVELGVTLLTYCYAYSGSPDIDALAFDPNFIRKHSFYGVHPGSRAVWTPSVVGQNEELGSFLGGSLSGLGFRLCHLETGQVWRTFEAQEGTDFVPTLLFTMRWMHAPLRSDRSQEYVALTVRLGREVLAMACLDETLHRWVRRTLAGMMSSRRREQADLHVDRANPAAAARALAPSELFLLGEAYFLWLRGGPHADPGEPPDLKAVCPVIDRLNEIVPAAGTADAERFRNEVEQYGILLRRRLGLAELSFRNSDSYEGLERSARKEVLYERVCDLKIRMAELGYSLGLPASLGELEAELALHDILQGPPAAGASVWQSAIEQVELLGKENVRSWVNELIGRGSLAVLPPAADGDPR